MLGAFSGLLQAAEALSEQFVDPSFIASAEVVYSPFLDRALDPSFIASAEVVYSPFLDRTLDPSFISSAEQIFAHHFAQPSNMDPTFIPSAETIYTPSLYGVMVFDVYRSTVTVTGHKAQVSTAYVASVTIQE